MKLNPKSPLLIICSENPVGTIMASILRRLAKNSGFTYVRVVSTTSYTANQLDFRFVPKGTQVIIVGISAIKDQIERIYQMVQKILAQNCKIIGICDTYDADQWKDVLYNCETSFDKLIMKPCSKFKSSEPKYLGHLFLKYDLEEVDETILDLCNDAIDAESDEKSNYVYNTIRTALRVHDFISENTERSWRISSLSKCFADKREANVQVNNWLKQYDNIKNNNNSVITDAEYLQGDKIARITVPEGLQIDILEILEHFNSDGIDVVIAEGVCAKPPLLAIYSTNTQINIKEILKAGNTEFFTGEDSGILVSLPREKRIKYLIGNKLEELYQYDA